MEAFLPRAVKYGWREDDYADQVEIFLGMRPVVVPSRLARMTIEFGLNRWERARRRWLSHDCAVFALAVESGNPLRHLSFRPRHHREIAADYRLDIASEDGLGDPRLEAGQIAFIGIRLNDEFVAPSHLMVRAGHDGENPIYFSKIGPLGPVVAHTLDDALGMYGDGAVGQAEHLRVSVKPPIR